MKVEENNRQESDEGDQDIIATTVRLNSSMSAGGLREKQNTQQSQTFNSMGPSQQQEQQDDNHAAPQQKNHHQSHSVITRNVTDNYLDEIEVTSLPAHQQQLKKTSTIDESSISIAAQPQETSRNKLDVAFETNMKARQAEEYDFKTNQDNARQLVEDIDLLADPIKLCIENFTMSNLPLAHDRGDQKISPNMRTGYSSGLLKDDMRKMDSQQRQQYIRFQLKSQGGAVRKRSTFQGAVGMATATMTRFSSREMIPSQCSSAATTKLNKRGGATRSKEQIKARNEQSPEDGSLRKFRRASNATHHFFNQRHKQRASNKFDCFDSFEQLNYFADVTTEDDAKSQQELKRSSAANSYSINLYQEPESHATTGLTYPNVPLNVKIKQKNRCRQNSTMLGSRGSTSKSKMMHFTSTQSAEKIAPQKKRPVKSLMQRASQASGELTHNLISTVSINNKPDTFRESQFKFNQAQEITLREKPVFDSASKTLVNLPSKVSNYMSNGMASGQTKKKETMGMEQRMIKQVEKDILVVREQLLQLEMERTSRPDPVDALQQQKQDMVEFDASVNCLRVLSKCFWRFEQATPVFKEMEDALVSLMDRKTRQIMLFEEQVRGRFSIIKERIDDQRVLYQKVEDHLRSEIAFRAKVFEREKGSVMQLIDEFEQTEFTEVPLDRLPLWQQQYSEVEKDLKVCLGQLMTNQVDMRAIAMSISKDNNFSLQVIPDAAVERTKRARDLQVKTAQAVIERFYDYKEKKEVASNTDPEQIAFMVRHYENSLEAMLQRETELQTSIKKQKKRTEMIKNKVDLFKKKNSELRDEVHKLNESLDEQKIKFNVISSELKNRENELYTHKIMTNDLKSQVSESMKLADKRLAEVQYSRTKQREAERQQDELIKTMEKYEDTMQELKTKDGNLTDRMTEKESEIELFKEEIARLKESAGELKDALEKKEELHRAEQQRFQKYRKSIVQENERKSYDSSAPSPLIQQNEKSKPKDKDIKVVKKKVSQKQLSSLKTQSDGMEEAGSRNSHVIISSTNKETTPNKLRKSLDVPSTIQSEKGARSIDSNQQPMIKKYDHIKVKTTRTGAPSQKSQDSFIARNVKSFTMSLDDGKCPTCTQPIKNGLIDRKVQKEVEVVKQFEQLVLGRRSSIYGKIMKDCEMRVQRSSTQNSVREKKLTQIQSNSSEGGEVSTQSLLKARKVSKPSGSASNSSPLRKAKCRTTFRRQKSKGAGKAQGDVTNFDSTELLSKRSKNSQHKNQRQNITVSQIVVRENYNDEARSSYFKHNNTREMDSQRSSAQRSSMARSSGNVSESTKQKLVEVTEKVSHSINYRFALDDARMADKKAAIKKKLQSNDNTIVSRSGAPSRVSFEKHSSQFEIGNDHGLTDKVNELYGGKIDRSECTFNDKGIQTNFTAEDVQRMFIHRVEDLMGMKPYRPVSASGKPRLAATTEDKYAEQVYKEQQSFTIQWRKLVSKVRNVANVEKMRRFEPLRKRKSRSQPGESMD